MTIIAQLESSGSGLLAPSFMRPNVDLELSLLVEFYYKLCDITQDMIHAVPRSAQFGAEQHRSIHEEDHRFGEEPPNRG